MFVSCMRAKFAEMLASVLVPSKKVRDSMLLQAYATFDTIKRNGNTDLSTVYTRILTERTETTYAFIRGLGGVSNEDLQKLMDAFLQLSLEDFLRFAIPGFVGDIEAALQPFKQDIDNVDVATAVHYIIQIKLIPFEIKKSGVQLTDSDGIEDVVEKLFRIYCSIESNAFAKLPRNDFLNLYRAVNQYALDFTELRISTQRGMERYIRSLNRSIDSLRDEMGLTKEQQVDLVNRFFVHGENDPKCVRQYKTYKFTMVKDERIRIGIISKAMANFAKMTPLECLCAIYLSKRKGYGSEESRKEDLVCENDITLENGLIFSLFSSAVGGYGSDVPVVIFFPSPFFVRKWLRDPRMKKVPTTFVFNDERVAELIQYHYCSGEYEQHPGDAVTFIGYQQMLNRIREGGRLPFLKGLLFACGWDIEEQSELYRTIKDYVIDSAELFALISTAEFERALSPFSAELEDPRMSIKSVALIPQGINNSSRPRRKLLLRSTVSPVDKCSDRKEKTKLHSFTLNTDLKRQALSRMYERPVEKELVDLVGLDKSIRKLFTEECLKRRATGRTRAAVFSYEFTPDITIWCSKSYPKNNSSRPRVDAYVCLPASEQKILRGYLDRGRRIERTVKRATRLSDDNVFTWLENEYPVSFVQQRHSSGDEENQSLKSTFSIREEVIAAYAPLLKGKDIAIKTLWYLHPNFEDVLSGSEYALFAQLTKTELGFLRLSELTVERCESLLVRCFTADNKEKLWARFKALSSAVDQAIKCGYCEKNPLKVAIRDRYVRDKLFVQVRSALTKKHFTSEEMAMAYNETLSRIKEGDIEYIGVLIRLLTGLESNIVSALKLKDFVDIMEYGIQCLNVLRQCTNDGKTEKGFDRLEDYRIIPCVATLSRTIKELISNIEKLLPEYAELQNIPIVTTYENVQKRKRYAAYSPRKIDQLCKEIVKAVGVKEHIVEVPSSDGGTKETNLSDYGGDFFRENFRFWALNTAKMELDEVQFLLGNKPDITFGRYYFDFHNDASQLEMFMKLQRWDLKLSKANTSLVGKVYEYRNCTNVKHVVYAEGHNPLRMHTSLKLKKGTGKVRLRVKGKLGLKNFSFPIEVSK